MSSPSSYFLPPFFPSSFCHFPQQLLLLPFLANLASVSNLAKSKSKEATVYQINKHNSTLRSPADV